MADPIDMKWIPNLPGYHLPTHKDRHHKPQTWQIVNETRMEMQEGVTHERPKFVKAVRPADKWRTGSLPDSTTRAVFKKECNEDGTEQCELPTWDAFDRHVLRFYGSFKESVVESNLENFRVRHVRIYYYLEDDTCQVIEPRRDNSGIPQGQLIRRHRFPSPCGGYLKPQDIMVGSDFFVYGRCIRVTDCDEFTRNYFEQAGQPQATAEPPESDPFSETRDAMQISSATAPRTYEKLYREVMLGGGHVNSDMQQFLENDRKVLRFYAIMDDLNTPQFERRPFVLLYFLADDTLEIREMYPLNCGRDNFPIFFRRGKMPMGQYTVDGPQTMPKKKSDYVDGRNFFIGQEMKLLNNFKFFLYDTDEFTRAYFQEEFGVQLDPCINVQLPERAVPRAKTPPYTGYGSWEDSISSVTQLIPKPPHRDTKKLAKYSGMVLRFKARFSDPKPEDTDRVFVVSFFLQDDCLSIHEPPQRNLGIVTGRFLEKGVHLNQITGQLFTPDDLLPGNHIKVYNHEFEMVDMDEYTRKVYADPDDQSKAFDLEVVKEKLRESLRQQYPKVSDIFRRVDNDHDGVITLNEFRSALHKFGFANLHENDVSLIFKHFDARGDGQVSYNEFCDALLEEDYPANIHRKAPIDTAYDEPYAGRAKYKLCEREETLLVRKAVRHFGDILAKRESMITKIIKELKQLTHESFVTLKQVQEALLKTGHGMEMENLERVVCHLMGPMVDLQKIEYMQLIKAAKTSFHEFAATR